MGKLVKYLISVLAFIGFALGLCGNGQIQNPEECDDGNMNSLDGCSMNCQIENGWSCVMTPSVCTSTCGDSIFVGLNGTVPENCDVGLGDDTDGCNDSCNIISGWVCQNIIGQASSCGLCNDGIRQAIETCEDGNTIPGDGCDGACSIEEGFDCPLTGACVTRCGDGFLTQLENCDDNNQISGDGCSSECIAEADFTCTVEEGTNGPSNCTRNSSSGLAAGAIAGIVIGVVCCICCLVAISIVGIFSVKKLGDVQKVKVAQNLTEEYELKLSQLSRKDDYGNLPDFSQYDEEPDYNKLPATEWEIPWSDLTIGAELGRGSFGIVRKGVWNETLVAIKTLQSEEGISDKSKKEFKGELEVMQQLRPYSTHVVALLGFTNNPDAIIVEYVSGGNLRDFLKTEKISIQKYPETSIRIAYGIAEGMCHLHSHDVVHRDLAARNILLTKGLVPKVSDFGLARLVQEDVGNYTKADGGPLKWMAPECVFDRKYSKKSDAWSFGIVLAEIYTRNSPYYGLGMDGLQIAGKVGAGKLTHPIPMHAPPEIQEIMKETFAFKSKERPDFEQLRDRISKIDTSDLPPFPPFDPMVYVETSTKDSTGTSSQ